MTKPGSWFARAVLIAALSSMSAAAVAKPDAAAPAQARVDAAAKLYPLLEAQWRGGRGTVDGLCAWSARWLDAVRDAPHTRKALTAALEAHRARMQAVADEAAKQVAAGTATTADALIAAYYLADAELRVARGQ
jgi:hypothetical protein